jgi:hypothetical protein
MICKAKGLIVWDKTGFEFSLEIYSYELFRIEDMYFDDASICSDLLRLGYAPEQINPDNNDMNKMLYYYYVDMSFGTLPDNMDAIRKHVIQSERDKTITTILI